MIKFKQAIGKILITFLLIYTTLWFIERCFFESILEKIIEKAAENGIHISYVTSRASGFPDDLTFHLRSVNVNFRDLVEMNSPGILIKVGLFFPFKRYFECSLENLTQGTFFKTFRFNAFQIRAKVFLEKMHFHGLQVNADSFIVMRNQAPIVEMQPFQMHATTHFENNLPLLHFRLQSSMRSWFGDTLIRTPLDIDTQLRIAHYETFFTSPHPLYAWHEKEGLIFFDECRIRGKQIDLKGAGKIGLNKNLFPQGNITLKVQGALPFALFIQNNLKFNPTQISLLQLGLKSFFKQDGEGYTVVPFQLDNESISFFGIPFMALPSLQ